MMLQEMFSAQQEHVVILQEELEASERKILKLRD